MHANIPVGKRDEIRDAICLVYNYQDEIEDGDEGMIPNPETKNQFANRQILRYLKEIHKKYKTILADTARITAINESEIFTSDITVDDD